MVRVAVDAMGGDNAPGEIVKGCLEALRKSPEVKILLCGKPEVLEQELAGQSYPAERLETVPASEVIETGDSPVISVRKKKDASLVVGMKLIREEKADAFVSAGNSGAILVGGQVLVGRLPRMAARPSCWIPVPMWMRKPPTWCSLRRWALSTWRGRSA